MKFEYILHVLSIAGLGVILIGVGVLIFLLVKIYLQDVQVFKEQNKKEQEKFPFGDCGPLALITCINCGKWPLWVSMDDNISKAPCPRCGKLIRGEKEE